MGDVEILGYVLKFVELYLKRVECLDLYGVQSSRVTLYSQGVRKNVRCNDSTLYSDRKFSIT